MPDDDAVPQDEAGTDDAPADQAADFGQVDKTAGSSTSEPAESPEAGAAAIAELSHNLAKVVDEATKAGVDAKALEGVSAAMTSLQTQVNELGTRNAATLAQVAALETQALDIRRAALAKDLRLDTEKLKTMNAAQLDAIEAVTPVGVHAPAGGNNYDSDGRGNSNAAPTTPLGRIRSGLD